MIALLALTVAFAGDDAAAPLESRVVQPAPTVDDGFDFLGLISARGVVSDLDSTNPFLDGQVIGQMGDLTGVVPTPGVTAAATEERLGGLFQYHPALVNGKAGIAAMFEVDYGFGDRSYGTGGNTGGAFGGDMVNLQTRRLYVDFKPSLPHHAVHAVLGLQFVGDSVNDPSATTPDGLLRSGGRLALFGSEAAGLAVYGRVHDTWGDRFEYRLGAFTLYEQGTSLPDDASLFVADGELHPAYALTVGAHAWYLQDRTGSVVGTLGIGPTSPLSELQGGPRLDPYDGQAPPADAQLYADLGWLGADVGYDAGLDKGAFGATGAVFANVGRIYAPIVQDYSVSGLFADAEARWRFARGKGSVLRGEAVLATADDADRGRYTGIVTGNSYGFAGAIWATHGAMLLFPDPTAINRLVSVVPDVSGGGRGLVAATLNAGYDLIPDRVNASACVAHAGTATGFGWGTEVNAKLSASPVPLFDVSLAGALVLPGPAAELDADPWTVVAQVQGVVF